MCHEKDSFDHFPADKTISAIVIEEKRSMLLHESEIHQLAKDGRINLVGTRAKVWLGIPLMVEGNVLGLMVVQDYENENAISKEHQLLLEMISPQISLSIKRKQNEQLLRESENQLRESNETKDRFFNIIAHDLKNPFNAIIGFASLLTDEWNEFDDDDKIAMISSIKSSSEGAFELLMNLHRSIDVALRAESAVAVLSLKSESLTVSDVPEPLLLSAFQELLTNLVFRT